MVSRNVNNHLYFKKRLEALGFLKVTPTALDNDALYFQIRDLKPNILIMEADFYECCAPFRMGELRKKFKKLKMVAVAIGKYPVDLAMAFITNGVNSYLCGTDGFDKIPGSLAEIARGGDFISPSVLERIDMRDEEPKAAGRITERLLQIIRLICCGFKDLEIAENMAISRSTVDNRKTEIYTSLNVRNTLELLRASLTLKLVKFEEIFFYPKGFTVNPQPVKNHRAGRHERRKGL
jgi:DNA-binding NarL/FixJ family response regulator